MSYLNSLTVINKVIALGPIEDFRISKEKNSNVFQALLSNLVSTRIYAVYNTMWSLPKLLVLLKNTEQRKSQLPCFIGTKETWVHEMFAFMYPGKSRVHCIAFRSQMIYKTFSHHLESSLVHLETQRPALAWVTKGGKGAEVFLTKVP